MPVNAVLIDPRTKKAYHAEETWAESHSVTGNEVIPVYLSAWDAHGTFKSANRTTAGITSVVTPTNNGSIIITDILVSGDKVNGGSIEIQFTDDTRTISIFKATVTDAPVNLGVPVEGRIQGWVDSRLQMVVVGNVDATVTVGYVKMPTGLPYDEWDSLR